jgi:serine/threonine-protein kinase RsbW
LPEGRGEVETRTFAMTRAGVAAIDDWLESIGARWRANERVMFGARLCVAELAANALEHGAAVLREDQMIVTVRSGRLGIEVEFLDSRAPFDPTVKPRAPQQPKSLESADSTGRGLYLIHRYAEELTYSHDGVHNRVKLLIRSAD